MFYNKYSQFSGNINLGYITLCPFPSCIFSAQFAFSLPKIWIFAKATMGLEGRAVQSYSVPLPSSSVLFRHEELSKIKMW